MLKVFRPLAQCSRAFKPYSSFQAYFATVKYTKQHEWVRYDEATQIGEVGITDYAQDQLGDIVHLDTSQEGTRCHLGQAIATIESVKSTAELYAPVTGEIKELNPEVINDCARINKDAESAWIFRMKLTNAEELKMLMTKEEYRKLVQQ